jgi:uncharacterized protein YjiS (DUF1127 family)
MVRRTKRENVLRPLPARPVIRRIVSMSLSTSNPIVTNHHQKALFRRRVPGVRFALALQDIGAAWIKRRRQAGAMQALYCFNDRELWDIGLSRSDLPAIENGTFRRD